ncbi:MAG: Vps62-related protein [Planctomycetota bacterium]
MKRLVLAALLLLTVFACSDRSGGSRGVVPGLSLAVAAATTSGSTTRPTLHDLAKRHAPIYRFNAWQPNDTSAQNRSEDFFPQSVVRYFDELATKKARVATRLASGATPGENAVLPFTGTVKLDRSVIHGVPKRMSGDEPGAAPIYVHAFEDTSRRVRKADGSGEDLLHVEYWLFYPNDLALVSVRGLSGALAFGGHRGDWESTSFAIAALYGPGGAFKGSEVRKGYYNGHGDKHRVARAELELDDEHPAVYVSIGKHASFPEPGKWLDRFGLAPVIGFDEFFLGNGFEWRAEIAPLVNLDGPSSNEFAPPSFIAIPSPFGDWRDFPGGWGSDKSLGPLAGSPVSPRFARVYGLGDAGVKDDWATVRRSSSKLVLGSSPRVVPAPVPIRK